MSTVLAVCRSASANLFVGNKLSTAQMVTRDGMRLDIRDIKSPILCFCSHGDDITPPQQALDWILDNYDSVDEIRRHQQTILYCLHPTAGHLAIFVGTKVAAKEHSQFVNYMDLIDGMPPGLWEIVITDKAKDGAGSQLLEGDFNVRIEERDIEDIRALGCNSIEDEREFEAVNRVSQLNNSLYKTFVQLCRCRRTGRRRLRPRRSRVSPRSFIGCRCRSLRCAPRVEAERRGYRQAEQVIAMGDGGNWIDPLLEREFKVQAWIIDWYHAVEHLWDCANAVHGPQTPQTSAMAEELEAWLWEGKVDRVIAALSRHSRRLGEAQASDPPQHPRRVLRQNVGYFTKHRQHMDYPAYRSRGWPIGSGETEASVKQFNKRVKGTEQFWSEGGIESILSLRAAWISQDDRWSRYWANGPAYVK